MVLMIQQHCTGMYLRVGALYGTVCVQVCTWYRTCWYDRWYRYGRCTYHLLLFGGAVDDGGWLIGVWWLISDWRGVVVAIN